MRFALLLILAALAGAVPASGAVDETLPGFTEICTVTREQFIRVAVSSITIAPDGWRVKAVLTNVSHVRLRIGRAFALIASSSARDRSGTAFRATTFSPPLPRELDLGQRWRGTFGGPGSPPSGVWLRLKLGPLALAIAPAVSFGCVTTRAVRRAP